jgi:hypothetical protein
MNYYEHFDSETNHGRVFDTNLNEMLDLPVRHLTGTEVAERENWRNKMPGIYAHYDDLDSPQVSTTELLLQQRVMVPNLGSTSVSSRSQFKEARRGRRYPPHIFEWDGFKALVDAFQPEHKVLRPKHSDIFQFSSSITNEIMALSDEKEEEGYLLLVLKKSLMMAGLLGKISSRGGLGKPDAITLKNDVDLPSPADIGLVAEFKSTHNLPLPMTDVAVVAAYNSAYKEVIIDRGGRTSTWSRVCHPVGQLIGYMVENGRRYGVLSSATRAYFLFLEGDGADAKVHISNPWFVGEPNFLRAWAYVHYMACQQSVPLVASSLTWKKTNKDHPTPPLKNKRKGNRSGDKIVEGNEAEESESVDGDGMSTNGQGDVVTDSAVQMSTLVETPIDDVEIIGTLGYGHNGMVFLANWHGQKVALKQFDVGKDGYEYFDKEVEAYLTLRAAWGTLVTTPLFVSESWAGWIKFIGLQLGRDPVPGDDISERSNVLSTLENEYGFRHDDAEDGNMVFVFDKKTGSERLVAIDLESHTMIK